MGNLLFRNSYKRCVVGVNLNAAVQGPDDACKVLSVSLCCQPDWQTSCLAEMIRDSIHNVDLRFLFPAILKRSGLLDTSKVRILVWTRIDVSN